MLRRTIAILVALAVLAERTALRAFPVRWIVLIVLRRAEAVAHGYVIDVMDGMWPGFEEGLESGSSPLDASLLALRLRMLAAILSALLPADDFDWTARIDGAAARRGGTRPPARGHAALSSLRLPAPNDTS